MLHDVHQLGDPFFFSQLSKTGRVVQGGIIGGCLLKISHLLLLETGFNESSETEAKQWSHRLKKNRQQKKNPKKTKAEMHQEKTS